MPTRHWEDDEGSSNAFPVRENSKPKARDVKKRIMMSENGAPNGGKCK
jgi:hypothetical protein